MNNPSITDWIQAVAEAIVAVLSLLLIVQLYLAKEQIRLSIQWNKLSSTFTFFTNEIFVEREYHAAEALKTLQINLYTQRQQLNREIVDTILKDPVVFKDVKGWLNLLEDYATAVHVGVLDPDSSFALMADVIIRHFRIFEILVKTVREDANNVRLWIELEKLALTWSIRRESEIKDLGQQLDRARQRYDQEQAELLRKTGANKRF